LPEGQEQQSWHIPNGAKAAVLKRPVTMGQLAGKLKELVPLPTTSKA